MGELGSRLKATASLLKPNIGCSGESRGALQERLPALGVTSELPPLETSHTDIVSSTLAHSTFLKMLSKRATEK